MTISSFTERLLLARVELLEANLEAWHRRALEAEEALVELGHRLAKAEADRDEVGNRLVAVEKQRNAIYGR